MKQIDTTTDSHGMQYSLYEEESKFGNFRIIVKDIDSGGILPIVFYKDIAKAQAVIDKIKNSAIEKTGKIFVPV